jgi:hypothetical protein
MTDGTGDGASQQKGFPAIFELDDSGEATGLVAHYCSEKCRFNSYREERGFEREVKGFSNDWLADELCFQCGQHLREIGKPT